ncbi:MAG: acetyltransferase, partial [Clostridia bacterium]
EEGCLMKKVIIIGASGHGRVIADIINCCGDEVIGFLDDRGVDAFPGLKILGRVSDAKHFDITDVFYIIGVGKNATREKIAQELGKLRYYTAIHPSAIIADDVIIDEGTVVMANAVVNTGSSIGRHCIINTSATVDHDNRIADFVHLSPGVHLSGTVKIGEGTWLGTGAVVSNNVNICGDCTVGAGGVVITRIHEPGTYVGIPVRKVKS